MEVKYMLWLNKAHLNELVLEKMILFGWLMIILNLTLVEAKKLKG